MGLRGVEDVFASSAFKLVTVSYNPSSTSPEAIEEELRKAGYAPGEDLEVPSPPEGREDSSPWFRLIQRVTETNRLDIEMAGDFRRY